MLDALMRAAMRFSDDGARLQMQLQCVAGNGCKTGKPALSGRGRSRGDIAHGKLQFKLGLTT
jgi:hypothetical protein